jgi:hypothetical protein
MKSVKQVLALSILGMFCSTAYAAPFTINPIGTLPTSIANGQSLSAYYTVTNKTLTQRNNNFVKHLPPNVTQVTTNAGQANLCGSTFNLAPGGSCTLQLAVTGPVNGNDTTPQNHLFVCFPGGKTCGGTAFGLNVMGSGTAKRASSVITENYSTAPDYIFTFPATATGATTPSYLLNTGSYFNSDGVSYNSARNTVWAGFTNGATSHNPGGSVSEYSYPATGTTSPIRTITDLSASLPLNDPTGIGFDAMGFIYVSDVNNCTIEVCAPNANGPSTPVRKIIPGSSSPSSSFCPAMLSVLPDGTIYVADTGSSSVDVFAPGSTGPVDLVPPIATIAGSNTGLSSPYGLWIDSNGNVWIVDDTTSGTGPYIYEFPANSFGNIAPITTISGGNTTINNPGQVAIDAQGYIYVANYGNSDILVFGPNANGNVAPVQTITSTGPAINSNDGIALVP